MANVWVVQRGNRVSFAAKTFADVLGGNFDGYIPAQPRISRAIHLAHAARAECGANFIGTKLCTQGERHKLGRLYPRETFAWYPQASPASPDVSRTTRTLHFHPSTIDNSNRK